MCADSSTVDSSARFIAFLVSQGFELKSKTRHHQYEHPVTQMKVSVQHPVKDIQPRNLASMLRQAGLKPKRLREFLGK